jgi:hypothetical protein
MRSRPVVNVNGLTGRRQTISGRFIFALSLNFWSWVSDNIKGCPLKVDRAF